MSTKGIAYHRNIKPGNKILRPLSISSDAWEKIALEALKHNSTKVEMVDAIINFYISNYVIVEQLSLSSNNKII